MPEGRNHDIGRNNSKRWSKTSICEIGNYFWDNPIVTNTVLCKIIIIVINNYYLMSKF